MFRQSWVRTKNVKNINFFRQQYRQKMLKLHSSSYHSNISYVARSSSKRLLLLLLWQTRSEKIKRELANLYFWYGRTLSLITVAMVPWKVLWGVGWLSRFFWKPMTLDRDFLTDRPCKDWNIMKISRKRTRDNLTASYIKQMWKNFNISRTVRAGENLIRRPQNNSTETASM